MKLSAMHQYIDFFKYISYITQCMTLFVQINSIFEDACLFHNKILYTEITNGPK